MTSSPPSHAPDAYTSESAADVGPRGRYPASRTGMSVAKACAAVCLAMVLIASPPQMLSPQEASAYAGAPDGSWPASHRSALTNAAGSRAKGERGPLAGQQVDLRNRPTSPPPRMEEFVDPYSAFPEFDGPIDFFLDRSNPSRPILYIQIK